MDHADDGNDVFIYMGGDQEVPRNVRYVRVHKSVKIITREAFRNCRNLVSIEMHDGVEIIEKWAFYDCSFLRGIKLSGVKVIGEMAFFKCRALTDVEFGDKLETIGQYAFQCCTNLTKIKLPTVRFIQAGAFKSCDRLTDADLSEDLEKIGSSAFYCRRLRRISIPLKANMLGYYDDAFNCEGLVTIELVESVHKTLASFHLESWKIQMIQQINRVNRVLLTTPAGSKTTAIAHWMETIHRRFIHYKKEHNKLLKVATSLLELALWKAKLNEKEHDNDSDSTKKLVHAKKKAKIDVDVEDARQQKRITSGAAMSVVIKNVLPFLKLEESTT